MNFRRVLVKMLGSSIRSWPAAWQVCLFLLVLVLQVMLWSLGLLKLAGMSLEQLNQGAAIPLWGQAAYVTGMYSFILLDIWLLQRWRQDAGLIGLEGTHRLRLLALGWAGGTGMLALQYLGQGSLGWMHWQSPQGGWLPWIGLLPMALAFAVIEEILFRGWLLHILLEKHRFWWALAWQALLYALAHFPVVQTAWPALIGLFLAGLGWGLVRLKSGNIWLGVGMHASWIYFIATVDQARLFRFEEGALPVTGGAYPVAGLFSHLLLLGLILCCLWGGAGHHAWKSEAGGIH